MNKIAAEHFQFSVGTLLAAVLYAAGLATIIVSVAGSTWDEKQVVAAYAVTIVSIGGFAAASRGKSRIAAYLIISPIVFVAAVSLAAIFDSRKDAPNPSTPSLFPVSTPQKSPITGPLKP